MSQFGTIVKVYLALNCLRPSARGLFRRRLWRQHGRWKVRLRVTHVVTRHSDDNSSHGTCCSQVGRFKVEKGASNQKAVALRYSLPYFGSSTKIMSPSKSLQFSPMDSHKVDTNCEKCHILLSRGTSTGTLVVHH